MKKSELDLKHPVYVVINGARMTWGSGNTIEQASKGAQLRKNDRHVTYRIGGIEHEPLTERDLDVNQNGGLVYEGYKVGDLLHPWVNNYGGLVAKGTVHKLVTMASGDEWHSMNDCGQAVSPLTVRLVDSIKALLTTPGLREFLDDNAPELVKGGIAACNDAGFRIPNPK